MCDHGPTHVDALSHLDPRPEAPSIEKMSLKLFYGDASCIDVSHKEPRASINAADIDGAIARSGVDVRKGDILLFYTGIRWVPRDKGVSQPVSWFRRIGQYVAGRKGIGAPVGSYACPSRGLLMSDHGPISALPLVVSPCESVKVPGHRCEP